MRPSDLPPLALPTYDFEVRPSRRGRLILDPVRRQFVRLTPEEWVRQHLLRYLIDDKGCPAALIAVEKGFTYQRLPRRADIVVHDRQGQARLIVECKAPEVAVDQAVFDQVAGYNRVLRADHLMISNGLTHYICHLDRHASTYRFLDDLPAYDALIG
ncbi:MAG: type I restriction enzyme HsdR N-terminal domain-containing protein [Bacteroidota bacterium]